MSMLASQFPLSEFHIGLPNEQRATMWSIVKRTVCLLAAFSFAIQISLSSEASEVNCDNVSAKLKMLQEALYHYSVLAEIPYQDTLDSAETSPYDKSCKVLHTGETFHPADRDSIKETTQFKDKLNHLLRSKGDTGSDDRLNGIVKDFPTTSSSDQGRRWNHQFIAIGDRKGVTYVGCRHDSLTPRMYVTWEEVTVSGIPMIFSDGDYVSLEQQQATVLVPQVFVAVTDQEGYPNKVHEWIDWEELGLVELIPIDDNSNVERVLAIRGTDFGKLSTVVTSVKDIIQESCAFETAAIIVKVIASRIVQTTPSRKQTRTNIIVTGHSLGGAATQYIGQPNLGPTGHRIRGYAFNAMGIDDSRASFGSKSSKFLYSQYVHGDPVSLGGNLLGRIQPGTVLVSKPASNLPNWLSDLLINPLDRHRLDTVQKALCQCLNGQGRVVEK